MSPGPRTKSGARLHRIGEEVYAVAIDRQGNEASERHPGTFYVAVEPGGGNMLFADEAGDSRSTFTLARAVPGEVRVGVFVDGDLAWEVTILGGDHLPAGRPVVVDWGPMYDAMR